MRSCRYICFCAIVFGWQLSSLTAQSEESNVTESSTETAWNETDNDKIFYLYQIPLPNPNEFVLGVNLNVTQGLNSSSPTDAFGNEKTTSWPELSAFNDTPRLRIKTGPVGSIPDDYYTFNELDYPKPPSYDDYYEQLIASAKNISASNESARHVPQITQHISPLSPFNFSSFGAPQYYAYSPMGLGPPVVPLLNNPSPSVTDEPTQTNAPVIPYSALPSVFGAVQPRMRSPPLLEAPRSTERSTTVATKGTSTKPKPTKKMTNSTKKRTLTTRRGKQQVSTATTTTMSNTKRFRAAVQRRPKATAALVHSRSTVAMKGFRSKAATPSRKQFRRLRRTRTPSRRSTRKQRRFRNMPRTKPTVRKTPIARPRFRKATQRPRLNPPQLFEYDFIYF